MKKKPPFLSFDLPFVVILLLLEIMAVNPVSGQAYHDKYRILDKQHDTTGIKKLLAEWEKVDPNDPELYTTAINFYFANSKRSIVTLDKAQAGKQGLQFTDSAGKVAGYMNSEEEYRPDQLALAFKFIDKGIAKFPNRLDMRFGKCYVLQQVPYYDRLTAELIRTIEFSNRIKNDWLWTNGKKLDDGEKFLLQTIQDYLRQLYDTESDSLLENIKQIGATTIKYYPHCVEILSTTAVANMLTKNYDIAIEYLSQAEKVNPRDYIVLNNLARGYMLKGDKENAVKYYELTEKYGDDEAKETARKMLKELKQ
jgi:tetratricopeptide (TPR) repeat protein